MTGFSVPRPNSHRDLGESSGNSWQISYRGGGGGRAEPAVVENPASAEPLAHKDDGSSAGASRDYLPELPILGHPPKK